MKRLGPGIYSEGETMHVDILELLEHLGWPDTEESRNELTEIVAECIREEIPDCEVSILTKAGHA